MFKLVAMPCFYETGKPGNWRACGKDAQWRIASEGGSSVCYCTRHKKIVAAKMGTPRILEHFKPATFAEFRKISC